MNAEQLQAYVIRPVLEDIGACSDSAVQLLLLTAAQESNMGQFIHQLGEGPAVGIYQMEPTTHDDIWTHYLNRKSELANWVNKWNLSGAFPYENASQMAGNLYYATAMARCHYLRVPEALPEADNIYGLARYYKRYYNTYEGASTIGETVKSYRKYI